MGLVYSLVIAETLAAQPIWSPTRAASAGQDLNAVCFPDHQRGWTGGDGGFLARTDDGGRTWHPEDTGITDAINDVIFLDDGRGFLLAGNAIIGRRVGEKKWSEIRRFSADELNGAVLELYSMCFSSHTAGWVVGALSKGDRVVDSFLAFTDDAGRTWRRHAIQVQAELMHLHFADEQRGWIVGAEGTIVATSDGGRKWVRQNSGTPETLHHVAFRDARRGWAVGGRGVILRTIDGGAHWAPVAGGPLSTLLGVKFADDNYGWIVGRRGVILRTENGGGIWMTEESGTKQHLYALAVGLNTVWAAGGDGVVLQGGLKKSP